MEEHLIACNVCLAKVEVLDVLVERLKLANGGRDARSYCTHLPLYSLEAAAGKFSRQQVVVAPERWIDIPPSHNIGPTEEMFVVHAKGLSMEPSISDGDLCVFQSHVTAPYEDKVVLLEHYGETGGNRYSIKRYHSSTNVDPNTERDAAWLHERMTLESDNPEFQTWDVASAAKVHIIGEFLFVLQSSPNTLPAAAAASE